MSIQKNVEAIFAQVETICQEVGRPTSSVNLLAVTKYVDNSIAKQLVNTTQISHIAENRVDKFLDKYSVLKNENLTWHLIGSLQRRKVKDVINYVDYFHALDSVKLAAEIQKRALRSVKCFLQVNLSREETKHGFFMEEIDEVIEYLLPFDKVEVVGLMTMAPQGAEKEVIEQLFLQTKVLQTRLAALHLPHMPFTELSMGMSQDFEIAIANGATHVRIGTAIFK